MSDSEGAALRIERLIPMEPRALFDLWVEPVQLAKWWAPEGFETVVPELDTEVGGRWRVAMHRADGGQLVTSGIYRTVDPPHRLSFTWAWEDSVGARGHETEVRVTFDAAPGGTRLVLIQERFESGRARDNHTRGWGGVFDRMTALAQEAIG